MDSLKISDVAKRLGISQSLAYALVAENRIRAIRLGRKGRRGTIRVREEDLQAFVEQTRESEN